MNKQPLSDNDCEDLKENIPAYVLGLLEDADYEHIQQGLGACPDLTVEVRAYEALLDTMLFSTPPATPPPHLKAELLAAARQQKTATPTASGKARRQIHWGVLAAALLGVLLVMVNLYSLTVIRDLRQANAALKAANQRLSQENAALNFVGTGGRSNQITFEAEGLQPPRGSFTWSAGTVENTWLGILKAENLPPLESGSYQFWLVEEAAEAEPRPSSAGVFQVGGDGSGMLAFLVNEPIGKYDVIAITAEPEGGSPTPTGDPVLVVPLRS